MADYSVKFIRRVKDFEDFIMDSWPVRNPCDYDDIGQYIRAIYQEISEIIDEGELDGIYVSEWLDYEEGKKYVDEVLKSKIVENYYWNCGDDNMITENVNSEDVINKLVDKLYDYTIGTKQVKNKPRMFTTSIYFTNKNNKHPEIEPIYFTWELDSVWSPKKLSFSESTNGKVGMFKKLGAENQFYEWAREKAKKHAEKHLLNIGVYLSESKNLRRRVYFKDLEDRFEHNLQRAVTLYNRKVDWKSFTREKFELVVLTTLIDAIHEKIDWETDPSGKLYDEIYDFLKETFGGQIDKKFDEIRLDRITQDIKNKIY